MGVETGDFVVVETGSGWDVGLITLSGDLVRLQMKKKRVKKDRVMYKVQRRAGERDMERMEEARSKERNSMIKARVISRNLGLEMKIGDVEYQADNKKATFYYTAEGRVDFRELVRQYAREFKVKIEMRQIGARQESGKIGGIGSCGRELCCSTWLTDFKSVNTSAARYQNLAINQSKLSGQCGRLKCCLNYELDTYLDALKDFPKNADVLYTEVGKAVLIKTDIFKRLMYYCYETKGRRGHIMPIDVEVVKRVLELNKKKEKPAELEVAEIVAKVKDEEEMEFADITGDFELPEIKRPNKKRRNNKSRRNRNSRNKPKSDPKAKTDNKGESEGKPKADGSTADKPKKSRRRWRKPKNKKNDKS